MSEELPVKPSVELSLEFIYEWNGLMDSTPRVVRDRSGFYSHMPAVDEEIHLDYECRLHNRIEDKILNQCPLSLVCWCQS